MSKPEQLERERKIERRTQKGVGGRGKALRKGQKDEYGGGDEHKGDEEEEAWRCTSAVSVWESLSLLAIKALVVTSPTGDHRSVA